MPIINFFYFNELAILLLAAVFEIERLNVHFRTLNHGVKGRCGFGKIF